MRQIVCNKKMSSNRLGKNSPWIIIDETGSEGDDNFSSMDEHLDSQFEPRTSKLLSRNKVKDKVSVSDSAKTNLNATTKDRDKAKKSKTDLIKTGGKGSNSKTEQRDKDRSSKTDIKPNTENAIVIDDDDDEDIITETSVLVKSKRGKESIDKVSLKKVKKTKFASKAKSEIKKLLSDDDTDDSDSVIVYPSSRSTDKKSKDKAAEINENKPNRSRSTKDEDISAKTSTADREVKEQELNSKVKAREKEELAEADLTLLSDNEITIDDEGEDDFVLKATKRNRLGEIDVGKSTRKVRASTSKKKFEIDDASESEKLDEDEHGDSDSVVEYHLSSKKTEKKKRDKASVTNVNKSNYKTTNKDKDVKATTSSATAMEVKKKELRSTRDARRDGESSEHNVTSEPDNEITISDEDDEDVPKSPVFKSIKRKKGSAEAVDGKRIKTTLSSSSKKKSAIDKVSQDLFGVDSASDPNKNSDDDAGYQFSKKAGRKDIREIPGNSFDETAHKASTREKAITARTRTTVKEAKKKRFNSEAEVSEEKESSEIERRLLDRNAIVIDDDNDDEDVTSKLPAKSTKRKGAKEAPAAKKAKIVGESSSKQKIEIAEEEKDLSAMKPGKDRYRETDSTAKADVEWSESDYLSEFNQIEPEIAGNLISLFKNDNTIPFIARYRKEMTGGMEPEQLRSIKNTYDNIKLIKQRALLILKSIDKLGKWSPEIHSAITGAKSMNELDLIYAPFKPGSKGSLAERAKELGLAPIGEAILQGQTIPHLSSLIDKTREGLKHETDVRLGIVHIIADIISKDKTTFEGINKLRKITVINIESTKSKAASSLKASKNEKQKNDHRKYEKYFNFVSSERFIKDYQILAINRGESQKILTVKIIIPDWFQHNLRDHCLNKYSFVRNVSNFHYQLIEDSFNDAYSRLIKPLVTRQVRHDLNARAESAAIEVFASNLKKLLLSRPLRGKTILGIDPGFTHGCKLAVISHCGNVLETATIYPHTSSRSNKEQQVQVLANLVKKYSCTIFALGNATACRETEMFLTELIQSGVFAPLDISYTIVNEAGASVYSCGSEAKSEFSNLDPNIISAISIARRLQDPLAELIKVDPQHLGIGMYQHDLPKKQLQLTLDEVISETVSFVGVDINTASHCLLRKVAGLSAARATNIIARRDENGPFYNRKELLDVKGIGKKCYEQCAGFIRILPETALTEKSPPSKKSSLDYLDQTWIHPESYNIARKFLKACECDLTELGTENFIQKILTYKNGSLEILAKQFNTSETSMDIIIKGLSTRKGEDIRVKEDGPLFQKNLRCMADLSVNTKLTGSVTNVTDFGTFVDIGVEKAGLIPTGKMKGQTLSLGQRVEVVVISIDKDRGRIALSL